LELVLIIFLVKDSFQGKAQVCRKNPLRPKMLGATFLWNLHPRISEVDVASKTSMDGSWNPSRLSFVRHLVPKTHGLDGDLVAEVGVVFESSGPTKSPERCL